jgi:pyruvate dehydrogenase E1 component alpha subunit
MVKMLELMYTMRRMEITCDNEYKKARTIRVFCHLYKKLLPLTFKKALTMADSWITSYRCHCIALACESSVRSIVGELFGVTQKFQIVQYLITLPWLLQRLTMELGPNYT